MSKFTKVLLVIALVGAVIGGVGVADAIKIWKNDIDELDDVALGSMSAGQMLEGDVECAYDVVATETTTQTYGFIPVSKTESPFYIVSNNNCYYLINVTRADMKEDFETLMEQSWDYIDGKTDSAPGKVHLTGQVVKTPDKVVEFLKEYCDEAQMTEDEYNNLVEHSYCVKTVKFDVMKYSPFIGFGVMLLCLIILIIKKIRSPKIVNL
ncbi:MAG: hypothetical protein IJ740_18125 [Ruminococcus sp.]|nr:hypothetical protein [Ruminococcus sp.]